MFKLFYVTTILTLLFFFVLVKRCYCEGHCPNNEKNGTCEIKSGGMCFTSVELDYDEVIYTYGCLPEDERGLMQVGIFF